MDLQKIFLKEACPTRMGGQAVLEGIMMKGETRTAVAVRLPDRGIQLRIMDNKDPSGISKVPFIRGAAIFFSSLVQGTRTLMYSADVLEAYDRVHPEEAEGVPEEAGGLYGLAERKLGAKAAWNLALAVSVALALLFTILIFIIAPAVATNLLKRVTDNEILLNLAEGILRILLFLGYVVLIARMEDIKTVFRYHGAEHKTIHCFENGKDLTPENARAFYRLHPRCGTSFLVFVMIISLLLFSFLGWPTLLWRVLSRVLLLPVIAGLSYELLRWAGRSDNIVVKVLSLPGLWLQKITTAEPDEGQLQVAICAVKAVLSEDLAQGEWQMDENGAFLGPVAEGMAVA